MTVKTSELNNLAAHEIVRGIEAGAFTAEAVTRACLERIAAREKTVKAWAFLDRDHALAQAWALDSEPVRGPLHGVPVGVKDVIDTADMPTQMGSPIYDDHRPGADASCVALMRAAGAVILGKTITCEFAGSTANVTTNPIDPARTPGGSSSGTAAAIADHMVTIGFGTQTGGSVLRPSSFCGIVGYKPSYNAVNRAGLKFAAESLDTIGLMTRTVADADAMGAVLTGRATVVGKGAPDRPRIGLCRTYLWPTAEPATVSAIEDAARRLAAAGAQLTEVALPDRFDRLGAARDVLNDYERAHAMAYEWNSHRDRLSPGLRRAIENGYAMDLARYAEAQRLAADCRGRLGPVFDGCDVLLAPCVPGEAPVGLASTGDPKMQGLWTILHVPTITLPTHKGPNGMPVGIQLVGAPGADTLLLAVADWVMSRLGADR
ncbi:MAG: amidase [Alphaproteobacteria bacterium]|nr:amidase [Alphaproteobacteria bacterium]